MHQTVSLPQLEEPRAVLPRRPLARDANGLRIIESAELLGGKNFHVDTQVMKSVIRQSTSPSLCTDNETANDHHDGDGRFAKIVSNAIVVIV
jgi:hypothetical protein